MLFLWIAALALAVVMEALTSDLVAIWFVPGALISLVLSLLSVPPFVQILVFLVVGTALVISTRPLCRRLLKGKDVKTGAEALIGKTCIVTEEIRNIDEVGEVKVGGLHWSARTKDPMRVIAIGEQVEILAIEGVKLIVQ